jgi:hypothetical protein
MRFATLCCSRPGRSVVDGAMRLRTLCSANVLETFKTSPAMAKGQAARLAFWIGRRGIRYSARSNRCVTPKPE